MRHGFALLVVGLVAAACSRHDDALLVECQANGDGCFCLSTHGAGPPASACDPSAFPGTTCCAMPGWPSDTTTCSCHTHVVACGVRSGYFSDGSDGCVCSRDGAPPQTAGATCFAGGTTTSPTLGFCCMFPSLHECACGAGLHTCGGDGSPVTTCSAANFPPPSTCIDGTVPVTSCATGTVPADASVLEASTSCASNADCDPTYQFCDKSTCDAPTGTCAVRPGQQKTYYCSVPEAGASVCGCDGVTYPGACFANAQGVSVATTASCE